MTTACLPDTAHHWIIEPAEGGPSQGQCQNCLEVRDFENWTPEYTSTGWSKMQYGKENRQDGGDFYPQGDR